MACGHDARCPCCYNFALEIVGEDQVPVPGCEPTSAITTTTLMWPKFCDCVLVDMRDALEAIPGSFIRYGMNWGNGVTQRWYVLPRTCPVCPCESCIDYYGILRTLCKEEVEEDLECEVIWKTELCAMTDADLDKPPVNYLKEGEFEFSLHKGSPWYIQSHQDEVRERNSETEEPEDNGIQQITAETVQNEMICLDDLLEALGD